MTLMFFNFRIDQTKRDKIQDRLRSDNEISQGWGGGSVDLDLEKKNFVQACFERYQPDMISTRVPSNLLRMRSFKDGDFIVTPHLPEFGKVSIHVVDGNYQECYRYVPDDGDHLNHRIRVKGSYGLGGNIEIKNMALSAWYTKLPWLRLPVLPIPEHEQAFQAVIQALNREPEKIFAMSPLEDRLENILDGLIVKLKADLRSNFANVGKDVSFEALCKRILIDSGYTIVREHIFDGKGGDVDIHCTRKGTSTSPFETGDVTLYVQVKKYRGKAEKEAVEQLMRMLEKDSSAEGCVMSLGDEFSPDAEQLAAKNDILLMNGKTICKLVLKTMLGE